MSVIRMIKMFGWEKKMCNRIDEKREVELNLVWWNKIYTLATLSFQCVIFLYNVVYILTATFAQFHHSGCGHVYHFRRLCMLERWLHTLAYH